MIICFHEELVVALQIDRLEQNGIKIVTRGDKEYPTRVKKRLGKNAPPLFYYAGDLALLNLKSIAIVGLRNISEEGQKIANDVAKKFTENKLAIVSGGAKGVDSISEQAALESGGVVVSFVADSLEKKIKNKEVRNDILARRKLLLTSQNPELGFSAGYAMNRNKYIYSVSSSAFVISSDYNKGGTWNGAIENIKNKWVPTYVYNSTISEGNRALIAKGAIAFDNIDNIDISALSTITYQPVKQLDLFNGPKVSDEKYTYPQNEYDAYNAILPLLKKVLQEEKTIDEIYRLLNVSKAQVILWLERSIGRESDIKIK